MILLLKEYLIITIKLWKIMKNLDSTLDAKDS